MIGKTLGNFTLETQIGAGGMGVVYQAKDQKLGRDVAIKVLPEEFAKDAERVARFQREAKLLASLNHPNIAAIHGLEEDSGIHFLVLELVEGQTLAERIKSDPVEVEEGLKLGLQIAEALEAAHEKGVIHRDLKPANIKVTPEGKVKVLDFGLAKAFAGEQADLNLSNSPTLSVAATQQGVILGTAAYMSPEQARGKEVDKRADIWAFGVVLFEMLAGRQVFTGDTVSDTLASVLAREPEWQSLPLNLHSRIRLLLERCLEKDPKNRYSGISDARVDIQKVLTDPGGVFAQPIAGEEAKMKMQQTLPLIATAIVLTAIIASVAVWLLKPAPPPEPRQVHRYNYPLPEGQRASRGLAISRDGAKLVFATNQQLYIKNSDELEATPIQRTEGAQNPFFSPDGQWIGYSSGGFLGGQLQKIPVAGGVPTVLCDVAGSIYGASWDTDDMIVFAVQNEIMKVSTIGGTPEPIVEPEELTAYPQMLPDGKTLLITRGSDAAIDSHVELLSLESGERKKLFRNIGAARYLPTGHIVFTFDNNLYAAPFDLDTWEVGRQVPVIEGVGLWAISDEGTLVRAPGNPYSYFEPIDQLSLPQNTLVWVDRDGNEEPLAVDPDNYTGLRISPDKTKVALVVGPANPWNPAWGQSDIWILDLIRGPMTQLTFFEGTDAAPVWTLNNKQIIFASDRKEGGIYIKAANVTGEAEEIFSMSDRRLVPTSLSSDGKTLLFTESDRQNDALYLDSARNYDIAALSMEGEPERKVLLNKEHSESNARISPDVRYIVHESHESDQWNVYLRPFPDVNKDRWPVSIKNGGEYPIWSPDGRELYYLTRADREITVMAVTVETEPSLRLGNPETLFQGTYIPGAWDIHSDGRFLMIKTPFRGPLAKSETEESVEDEFQAEEEPTEEEFRNIISVTNWFEELKEKAPLD